MFNGNSPSLADIAAVTGNNKDGWGDGNGWWVLIILFAIFGGWGNGFGGGYGNGCDRASVPCATQADVRAAVDQQTLISKIDQQTYGLSSTFTALNDNLNSNFRGIDNAICTLGYQNQQGFNNLGHQISDCCCATQRAIDGVNYNMATQACDTRNLIQSTTRDIIDNANANSRALLDFLVNDKISTLQAENQALKFQASQSAQNAYLVNELRPCPIPAYITCNPYAASYGYGLNNGCGCGCGSNF